MTEPWVGAVMLSVGPVGVLGSSVTSQPRIRLVLSAKARWTKRMLFIGVSRRRPWGRKKGRERGLTSLPLSRRAAMVHRSSQGCEARSERAAHDSMGPHARSHHCRRRGRRRGTRRGTRGCVHTGVRDHVGRARRSGTWELCNRKLDYSRELRLTENEPIRKAERAGNKGEAGTTMPLSDGSNPS